jgi:serine/threonine-protein kinase
VTGTVDRLTSALANRYRIERELGRGGMATVYLAEDLKHQRRVAVKVLRPELAAALGHERFLREITTTANLRHPHILPLYDSGEADGFVYYVMPFVEGESLRGRLTRERQLPLDDALQVAREVADALSYAHSRGVIHRDIKPENILLESGHAVVADFGIARAVDAAGGAQLTETGLAIGTPAYMSPEQAAGQRDLDGRSDLYGLACVLYEMLAGQPPFSGPTVESIIHQHLTGTAPPITQIRPAVPAEVAGALQRALAKTPADRFNPVALFGDALRRPGPAASPPGGASAGARPTRLPVALALVLLLIIAGWLGTRAVLSRDPGAEAVERIAVLPLDNATGDSSQAFFADGMTRELIGVLTDAGVRVLGHRAVAAYHGSTLPAAAIARTLGVDAIVTGAVLQAGEVVQVAAELTEPASGESLWARTFSRPATGVVSLQHEIASEIARGIRARLTPDQERLLGTSRAVNPEAYAQYLLGVEQVNLRSPEGYRRSLAYLHRSLALDSTFAPAWASLAMTHAVALFFQMAPLESAGAAIEVAAARALALDDGLGDALIARGMGQVLLEWDFAGALAAFERGVERNPTTMGLAVYAWFPWQVGQFAKAIAATSRLVDLEPTTAQWHSDLAWWYWSAGDTAASRAAAVRAVALDSAFYEPYHALAWLDASAGASDAARRSLARAAQAAGGDFWLRQTAEAYIMVRSGDSTGARRVLRAMQDDPRLAQRAILLHALGDLDGMYAMLDRAIDARDSDAIWVINAFPPLRSLRGEPRYQRLLDRMGLPEDLRR